MTVKVSKDDRPFWWRRSILGENISNGNWIIALILLSSAVAAISQLWIGMGAILIVAGLLSFVWNEGVAKTTYIITAWVIVGGLSAFLLAMVCTSMFGMPILGHILGLIIGIAGVVMTID